MKAWLLPALNGIQTLQIGNVPDPTPAPNEVILDVEYAALNPADRYLAEGQYPARPTFPHILGRDAIGTITAVGADVTSIKTGEKMLVLRGDTGVSRPGTFAQRVAVAADSLVCIPAGWSDQEAAGATLVYLTAFQALTQWDDLAPGVVLVTGASGGVGVASIQLGAALGHMPIGLSRSAEKSKVLKTIGAAATFDPRDPQWRHQLKEFLGGRRVNLAIDNIGGALFNTVLETLGENGRLSVVGRLAGPVPEFNTATLFFRRLRIGGVAVGTYGPPDGQAAWKKIIGLMAQSKAKPLVDQTFNFDQLPAAFERLAQGPMGKVLLKVDKIK